MCVCAIDGWMDVCCACCACCMIVDTFPFHSFLPYGTIPYHSARTYIDTLDRCYARREGQWSRRSVIYIKILLIGDFSP